ncbi:MAG: AMP-binding protein, partial [Candidatus Heimdallarchaeota archaeon]|nr:AMP-binding protein [Candidatus Heimdallarchaeota archaeon]
KYIQNSQLTIWFSVPSTAIFMKRLNTLKKCSFPSIRLSLFCGEPLPEEVVRAWSKAVPNSIVENLYGPTELTIACTYYRWNSKSSDKDDERDILPIGYPFPGMSVLVVDDDLNEVLEGAQGELLMSGPQVALGYWKEHEKTMKSYVIPAGKKETFYRTGDIVRRPFGNNPLIYVGRIDSQIKVLGYRVELGEIETVVREESGIDAVVALGWPVSISSAQGIEVFVEGDKKNLDVKNLRTRVSLRLPEYMVPRKFHMLKEFPLNVNGKIDRKALQKILESQ